MLAREGRATRPHSGEASIGCAIDGREIDQAQCVSMSRVVSGKNDTLIVMNESWVPAVSPAATESRRPTAALILGAGWSRPAGLPLAGQLFDEPPGDLLRWAGYFARDVPEAFLQWKMLNPHQNAEQFVGRVYEEPFPYVLPGAHFPHCSALSAQMQLPEPSDPRMEHWLLRWPAMVEYLQLRLAWPLDPFRWPSELRYKPQMLRASSCAAHIGLISELLQRFELTGAVTTNYDVTAEQALGAIPRSDRPGFNYGRMPAAYHAPNSPFARERNEYRRPSGSVGMSKLHGSLNWSLDPEGNIIVYCDLRAAFRKGGTAAIIPPLPEKQVPHWLGQVWEDAFEVLSKADTWIVVGYSLPVYDIEVRRLFKAASHRHRIEVFDPNAASVAESFSEVAPKASFELHDGLPNGLPRAIDARRGRRRNRRRPLARGTRLHQRKAATI